MKQKALFLDRDGVINIDHGYIYKKEDFVFCDGIFELVKIFAKNDFKIYIVTNQSGIARGYYNVSDFRVLTKWMKDRFEENGIFIEDVFFCPHLPQENCNCRKPKIGMIQNLLTFRDINLDSSWLIGDKQSDIDFAKNAKIGYSIAITNDLVGATLSFKNINECLTYFNKKEPLCSKIITD